jgi:hypothetical protein
MNIFIRISLTVLLMLSAFLPYYDKEAINPQAALLRSIGNVNLGLICSAFLGMVALYCRDIQTCLNLVSPENRKMSPKSAWRMFLLPFNFVEDFFIVISLSNSIEAEARVNPKLASLKDFGMVSGIGWSIAQVLSFIPNDIGQVAGLFGFVLVVVHWIFIRKIIALLA